MISSQMYHLSECLKKELPGQSAQELMAPSVRPPGMDQFDGSNPRSSGVMILLFPAADGLSIVFIHRTPGGPHGGQISLPGGKAEKSDPDLFYTAKRETFEEVGVDPELIKVVGKLTPLYVPHSNYIIQPVIGYLESQPDFICDEKEVNGVIIATLKNLFNPENRKTMVLKRSDMEITAPYYDASGYQIWGATAMIMSEFEQIFISCIS